MIHIRRLGFTTKTRRPRSNPERAGFKPASRFRNPISVISVRSVVKIFRRATCTLTLLGTLFMPATSNAEQLCVRLESPNRVVRQVTARPGATMRLTFRHSIYGSQVDELFALRQDGFQPRQLRYAEARLAEFYGHDNAKFDKGAWVVQPNAALLPSVNLILSADAAMALHFEELANRETILLQPGGALRLTVASCPSHAHG